MADREAYLKRIKDFVKPDFELERKFFRVRKSVKDKVDKNNCFKGFFGDTTVFDLKPKDKRWFSNVVDRLYAEVPECFCERLAYETYHVTLHDLSCGCEQEDVEAKMKANLKQIKKIQKVIEVSPMKIRMKTQYIANILNISLVYVLCPVDEKEYLKLMTLYHLMDTVQELDYKYTPHITLGYFNVNGFDVDSVEKLERLVRELNKESHEFTISTKELFYQQFESMNDYKNVCRLFNK